VNYKVGDRMDRLVTEAVRQGFRVWQTPKGSWMFRTGNITVHCAHTPQHWRAWQRLMFDLIKAGLEWPPPMRRR
jgi:hypothetical protein